MITHSQRTDRIARLVRSVLADLLLRQSQDPRFVQVSLTSVDVSRDLGHARIGVTFMGAHKMRDAPDQGHEEKLAALQQASGYLRSQLARSLRDQRKVPKLHFVYDAFLDQAAQLSALIDTVAEDAATATA